MKTVAKLFIKRNIVRAYDDEKMPHVQFQGVKRCLPFNFQLKTENITEQDIKNKSFYRMPKILLPQSKTEILKEKHDCKIIRDWSKADYIIVNENTVNHLKETTTYYVFETPKFIEGLDEMLTADKITADYHAKLVDEIKALNVDYISTNYVYSDYSDKAFCKVYNKILNGTLDVMDVDKTTILFDPTNKFVLDSDLIKIIQTDFFEITPEVFDNILEMLNSSDSANHEIALEMIANTNIEKSYSEIAFLYGLHYSIFKNLKNFNSINVKTLRNEFRFFERESLEIRNIIGIANVFESRKKTISEFTKNYMSKLAEHLINITIFKDSPFSMKPGSVNYND